MTENLAHPQFSKGLSGYKVEEVDSYIDKVLDTIKDLKDQNEVLEEKIGVLAESLQKYREDASSIVPKNSPPEAFKWPPPWKNSAAN